MPRETRPGRLGHGYEIRVKHAGQLIADHSRAWGVENALPEAWQQFKQEATEDETIEDAQIYRNTERRKNMKYRRVLDSYIPGEETEGTDAE